jgi:hypothetical protein
LFPKKFKDEKKISELTAQNDISDIEDLEDILELAVQLKSFSKKSAIAWIKLGKLSRTLPRYV